MFYVTCQKHNPDEDDSRPDGLPFMFNCGLPRSIAAVPVGNKAVHWLLRRQLNMSGDGYMDPVTKEVLRRKYFDKGGLHFWLKKLPLVYVEAYAQSDGTVRPRSKVVPQVDAIDTCIIDDEDPDDEVYTVDYIETFRVNRVDGVWTFEYYVKWEGFLSRVNGWEPASNITYPVVRNFWIDVFETIRDGSIFIKFPPSNLPTSWRPVRMDFEQRRDVMDKDEKFIVDHFPMPDPEGKRRCIELKRHLEFEMPEKKANPGIKVSSYTEYSPTEPVIENEPEELEPEEKDDRKDETFLPEQKKSKKSKKDKKKKKKKSHKRKRESESCQSPPHKRAIDSDHPEEPVAVAISEPEPATEVDCDVIFDRKKTASPEPLTPADQRRLILQATEARLGILVREPSPGPSSSAVGNEAVVVKTEAVPYPCREKGVGCGLIFGSRLAQTNHEGRYFRICPRCKKEMQKRVLETHECPALKPTKRCSCGKVWRGTQALYNCRNNHPVSCPTCGLKMRQRNLKKHNKEMHGGE